jgi:hypothetical protein
MSRPDADRALRRAVKTLIREAVEANGKQVAFAAEYQVSPTYVSKILGGDGTLDVLWHERARAFIGREAARALDQKIAALVDEDRKTRTAAPATCPAVAAAQFQAAASAFTLETLQAHADGEVCAVERTRLRDLSHEVDRRQEDLLGAAGMSW